MQPPWPIIGEHAWAASPISTAAAAPLVELQPFDRSAVDLLVLVQTGEIFLHQPAKLCEAVAEASEPALHRILHALLGCVAKAVGPPVADRAEPKEAPVAEPKLQARQAPRTDRGNAAPCHLSAVNRRGGAQAQLAQGRRYPVGADDEVVVAVAPIAEVHPNLAV